MEKEKHYARTHFTADVISDAERTFEGILPNDEETAPNFRTLRRGSEVWNFDSDEEFFAEYRSAGSACSVNYDKYVIHHAGEYKFRVQSDYDYEARVAVRAPTRPQIEAVFEVFERSAEACRLPEPASPEAAPRQVPSIFVGHGRSQQWRDLKDHLHERHGYPVVAYEIGDRAGHVIRDILEEMMAASSIAFLIMTGDDETADRAVRARQNVVHEIGLFEGHLGFARAIVLLEEGVEEFSNLQGIHQIRYSRGKIKETFGGKHSAPAGGGLIGGRRDGGL